MTLNISTQLKEATASLHKNVESKMGAVLFRHDLDPLTYQVLLQRMKAAYEVLENAVTAIPEMKGILQHRSKIKLLDMDLEYLRGLTGQENNQFFPVVAKSASPASAWGLLYVMEGATLGGAVISRQLSKHAWASRNCLNFFSSYGVNRSEMWKEFLASLHHFYERYPNSDQQIVEGATTAFRYMDEVMNEK